MRLMSVRLSRQQGSRQVRVDASAAWVWLSLCEERHDAVWLSERVAQRVLSMSLPPQGLVLLPPMLWLLEQLRPELGVLALAMLRPALRALVLKTRAAITATWKWTI